MSQYIYIYIYIENCEQCGGELLVYEDNKLHDITAECLRCGMNYANLQLPQEYVHVTDDSLRKGVQQFERNNQDQNGVKLVSGQ